MQPGISFIPWALKKRHMLPIFLKQELKTIMLAQLNVVAPTCYFEHVEVLMQNQLEHMVTTELLKKLGIEYFT